MVVHTMKEVAHLDILTKLDIVYVKKIQKIKCLSNQSIKKTYVYGTHTSIAYF